MSEKFYNRLTEYYPYLFIPTQAVKTLKSALSSWMPMAPTEKTNLFLGKTIEVSVCIIQFSLVGWLLSQSVGLMLFTAFFPINYYRLKACSRSTSPSENESTGDQQGVGFIAASVRLLAGILNPMRVASKMMDWTLIAYAVGLVTKVASVSSVVSVLSLALSLCAVIFVCMVYVRLEESAIDLNLVDGKDNLWITAVIGSFINCYMFYFGGDKLLSSVFRLSTVCHSPMREFAKAAVAVSFSSVMLNELSHTLDEKSPIRAPWTIEAVD